MDFQDRDEPKDRRRQEYLARRIGEALDKMDAGNARNCPDGEILAAYAERGLSQEDAGKWEGHFATCSRCRKILQVLSVSADAPLAEKEVAHLGEQIAAARAAAGPPFAQDAKGAAPNRGPGENDNRSGGRGWPRIFDWRMRWLAPAMGVAAVLLVWFAMRPPWRATNRGAAETLIAQAPQGEVPQSAQPAEGDRLEKAAPSQEQNTDPNAAPAPGGSATKSLAPNSQAVPSQAEADEGTPVGGISHSADTAANSTQEELKKEAPESPNRRELTRLAPFQPAAPPNPQTPGPAPSAQPPQAKAASNMAAAGALQAQKNSDAVTSAAPQARQRATMQAPPAARANAAQQQGLGPGSPAPAPSPQAAATFRAAQNTPALVKAPGSPVVWRVGKGGSIEKSSDGGATWAAQTSPSQQDWLAGAALSDRVCWLVGRSGAIARTANGESWALIASPAQAAGPGGAQPDWTGITALDALNATVTAADGRKFETPDGGLSWQPQ